MRNLPLPLQIVILDTDIASAGALKAIIETKPDIEEVRIFNQTRTANEAFRHDGFNSLFIYIFSLGVKTGIDFIEHVRTEYPIVPICLYSLSSSLVTMPEVPNNWRSRFGHYFKLPKDQTVHALDSSIEDILYTIAYELQGNIARYRLSNIRARLSDEITPYGFTPEQKQEIVETVAAAEKALVQRENQPSTITIVPGVNTGQLEQLVNITLKEATASLQLTTKVNIAVLVAGSLLLLISFIVAAVTDRWEAVAFGGFGTAGIIASLITNPLKSISANARRLVHVQVAYLQFLSQLAMLNQVSADTTIIERSQRLGEAMTQTLKALEEHFGK